MTRSMPAGVESPGRASIGVKTLRKDPWWQMPLATFVLLGIWIAYSMVHVISQRGFWVAKYHYLSPFDSPCVSLNCPVEARDFGTWFGHFPSFLPLAIISLVLLGGFRTTCYYYRKAYYRSFYLAPAACGVAEPHGKYTGETRFPLIMQNVHRYFWVLAVILSLVDSYDVVKAFHGGDPNVDAGIGMGLGTLIMLVNAVLLWMYTLGCHSCRHIMGGRLRHFSKHPIRYRGWTWVSWMNGRHMQFAWTTLGTLMMTDLYIWLVSAGVFNDPRFFN